MHQARLEQLVLRVLQARLEPLEQQVRPVQLELLVLRALLELLVQPVLQALLVRRLQAYQE